MRGALQLTPAVEDDADLQEGESESQEWGPILRSLLKTWTGNAPRTWPLPGKQGWAASNAPFRSHAGTIHEGQTFIEATEGLVLLRLCQHVYPRSTSGAGTFAFLDEVY